MYLVRQDNIEQITYRGKPTFIYKLKKPYGKNTHSFHQVQTNESKQDVVNAMNSFLNHCGYKE